mgnify:CR=1 FL=1
MHILHNYIAHNLADHLRKARVVVWYDPTGDYQPFIAALRGQPDAVVSGAALPDAQLEPVQIDTLAATLCCYAGSFLAVRLAVEGRKPVEFYGRCGGNTPSEDEVLKFVREVAGRSKTVLVSEEVFHG